MKRVNSWGGYDYYEGKDETGKTFYNIIIRGMKIPDAGYYDKMYIVNIKKVPNLFNN